MGGEICLKKGKTTLKSPKTFKYYVILGGGVFFWWKIYTPEEINSLYYKILKTSIGAGFNIWQSISEVILGLPPVHIQNRVGKIQHYLKININNIPEDQLKETIKEFMSSPIKNS